MRTRRLSRQIKLGNILIGGGSPVTNTDTRDVEATVLQIKALEAAGCEIIRSAVPDMRAAEVLKDIIGSIKIPLIADIHFDYKLALASIKSGVHGIRINPGNIGASERVKAVAEAAAEAGIPIRIGVNGGSLPAKQLEKLRNSGNIPPDEAVAEAIVNTAIEECAVLESFGFRNIKVSLKSSRVPVTVEACRRFAERTDYPLHLGVTEAGTLVPGLIKSSLGIGVLLMDGIGDTVRISLTADPVEEVRAGVMLLEAAGLRTACPEIVSCPTCGRTQVNILKLAELVEENVARIKASGRKIKLHKIAVMGCVVNGPGEASDADIGIAGSGPDSVMLFKKGKRISLMSVDEAMTVIRNELLSHSE